MASQPVLTFQNISSPFSSISALNYVQSAAGDNNLPVLQGQNSDPLYFRLYNNFALAAGIASAINVHFTVYDGAGVGSHTCAVLPVSQSWIHLQQTGYGENSTTSPDQLTAYLGTDTAIGGNAPCGSNIYYIEKGSDGTTVEQRIRAYSNQNGMGYAQFKTYAALPPSGVQNASYTFAFSVSYEWFT